MRPIPSNASYSLEELPKTGSVLITKNGKARAVLLPVDDDTDLESLLLSQNKWLWELIDRSIAGSGKRRRTRLDNLPE